MRTNATRQSSKGDSKNYISRQPSHPSPFPSSLKFELSGLTACLARMDTPRKEACSLSGPGLTCARGTRNRWSQSMMDPCWGEWWSRQEWPTSATHRRDQDRLGEGAIKGRPSNGCDKIQKHKTLRETCAGVVECEKSCNGQLFSDQPT